MPTAALALMSAALFGASTPLAKLLLGAGASPGLLAGLLYLGSGIGLSLFIGLRKLSGARRSEAPLRLADWPWLALTVVCGGVIGPLLLMVGLAQTAPASASLLLNAESLFTMAIAWIVFRENVDRRLLVGAMAILAGAMVLSWTSGPAASGSGPLWVLGACLAWAVLGYGVSLVLFVLSLRDLGAARTGAYFSTAPFMGALLSLALFHDPLSLKLLSAAVLMGIGVYLHLSEKHAHEHEHEPLEHEHRHVHDAHHQHSHGPDDPPGEPHVHRHRHGRLKHSHAHYPDLHHRHDHG